MTKAATKAERVKARNTFLETGCLTKAAEAVGRSRVTVVGWCKRERWNDDLEKVLQRSREAAIDRISDERLTQEATRARAVLVASWSGLQKACIDLTAAIDLKSPMVRTNLQGIAAIIRANAELSKVVCESLGLIQGGTKVQIDASTNVKITPDMQHAVLVDAIALAESGMARVAEAEQLPKALPFVSSADNGRSK